MKEILLTLPKPLATSAKQKHLDSFSMEVSVVTLAGDDQNSKTVKCLIIIVLEFSSGEQLVQFCTAQQERIGASLPRPPGFSARDADIRGWVRQEYSFVEISYSGVWMWE